MNDSGGIQEESTFFGIPCIKVRKNTERPITVSLGTNKLIGTEYERIPGEIKAELRNNSKKYSIPSLWDGKSSDRISKIIESYFYPNSRN